MDRANLFQDELRQPIAAIAYRISRRLKELCSGKFILETGGCDLEAYADEGLCSLSLRSDVHSLVAAAWDGPERPVAYQPVIAWHLVVWQGHTLEAVSASWPASCGDAQWRWLIADSRGVAEGLFQTVCAWTHEVRAEVLVFAEGYWRKSAPLFQAIQNARFESLILRGSLKSEIRRDFEQFLASRETYARYAVPWKRGVLFIGPPGNGKTHCVKALINHLGLACLYVQSFKTAHSTDQSSIQSIFYRARRQTPCVLVLEDLDSLITPENRSFFLNELDGFAANEGMITLATTNHPERLDPAILDRPSRFDMKYHFELPGPDERLAYLTWWNERLAPELKLPPACLNELQQHTDGFSFAYMKELFLSSITRWVGKQPIGGMPAIISAQAQALRAQMKYEPEPSGFVAVDEVDEE